jgi:AAA15 family ATPase/GTPase
MNDLLKEVEIVDYKCFQDFKLTGLSKINIITGENNVGKTALLEALLLIDNSKNIRELILTITYIYQNRDLDVEYIRAYLSKINLEFKSNKSQFSMKHKFIYELDNNELEKAIKYKNEEFLILYSNNKTLIEIFPFYYSNESLPFSKVKLQLKNNTFIDSSRPYNKRLTEIYASIQKLKIQNKFLKYLQILDKNIIRIEPYIIDNTFYLQLTLNTLEEPLISAELGEGVNRYIEILATILTNKDKIILIDEIENGIHHSKLKDIWKAIIEIVEKENIQLFVTTHDKDTIKAFNKACEEKEFKEIISIELFKKDNIIHPIIRDFQSLNATVNSGMEIR